MPETEANTDLKSGDIKLAYFLLVHNKPEQLNMFLKQILLYGDCDIYIHVDRKNSGMISRIIKDKRIRVISKYEVKWASFEMMAATIAMMKLAVKSGRKYTHAYYGSGNDLLVKRGLYEHLAEYPDKLFMKINEKVKPTDPGAARYRIKWNPKLMVRNGYHPYRYVRWFYHVLFRHGIVVHENKTEIEFEDIYRASQWFVVPYDVIKYIIEYLDNHPAYVQFWKHSLAPDEFMLQTIIMNSGYREKIMPPIIYIHFKNSLMGHNHPDTITMNDVVSIEYSGCFAARKFDTKVDKQVIEHYLAALEGTWTLAE